MEHIQMVHGENIFRVWPQEIWNATQIVCAYIVVVGQKTGSHSRGITELHMMG